VSSPSRIYPALQSGLGRDPILNVGQRRPVVASAVLMLASVPWNVASVALIAFWLAVNVRMVASDVPSPAVKVKEHEGRAINRL
jgi:hypothetical protein